MAGRYLLLFLGVFACSTSAIQTKLSETHPVVLAALRLLIAGLLLSPIFLLELKKHRETFTRLHLRRIVIPSAVLAVHLISWSYGARLALAAQSSLIVNLVPAAMPFFLNALLGEKINRREILGTTVAIAGVLVLTLRDALSGGDIIGNVVCFGSMLLFAWYLALGRKNRDFPSLWLYVVPVYALAGTICLIASLPWIGTFKIHSTREWSLMFGLACIPTILGHSLLNAAMRHLRGQIVGLCNVGQFVFAGFLAFFIFGEVPPPTFYAASLLVVAGIGIVVFSAPTPPPRMR
ncbi:MAG: DMT family transporter [Opitutaceae bacterium]